MSTQLNEIPGGRQLGFTPPTITTQWCCEGEHDENIVAHLVRAGTPAVMTHPDGAVLRQNIQLREEGHQLYTAVVTYGGMQMVGATGSAGPLGTYSLSFDTTGGSVHVSHSKETIAKYPSATAPDHKQLIGVHGDQVDGADQVIPAMKLTVHFKHPAGIMTLPRIKYIGEITGMVSSVDFLTFAAGEVLFLGATGSEGNEIPAEVQYQFAMSVNAADLSIGAITGIAKKGWEYVWISYKNETSAVGGVTSPVKQPQFAYVERLYETVNLVQALGFG